MGSLPQFFSGSENPRHIHYACSNRHQTFFTKLSKGSSIGPSIPSRSNCRNPSELGQLQSFFLYLALHHRPREAQMQFLPSHLNMNDTVRDKIQTPAIPSFDTVQNYHYLIQSANLLDLFFALEFSSACPSDPVIPAFLQAFN
jgi:hypothetical protein